MTERVVPSQIDACWDPNVPAALLVVTDAGLAALALRPRLDDADRDCVVFVWPGTYEAVMGSGGDGRGVIQLNRDDLHVGDVAAEQVGNSRR